MKIEGHSKAASLDSWSGYIYVVGNSGSEYEIRRPRLPFSSSWSVWGWSDKRGSYLIASRPTLRGVVDEFVK